MVLVLVYESSARNSIPSSTWLSTVIALPAILHLSARRFPRSRPIERASGCTMVPFVRLYAYVFVRAYERPREKRAPRRAVRGKVSRGCTHVARRISPCAARAAVQRGGSSVIVVGEGRIYPSSIYNALWCRSRCLNK